MRIPELETDWPESWKKVNLFDKIEVLKLTKRRSRGHSLAYNVRLKIAVDLICKSINRNARILDVAAAQGTYTLALAERGYEVVWNDIRAELEGYVRLKYEHGSVSYAAGNVFELSEEESFDAVVIAEIIEHVAHPDEFLFKISKLVKPGGLILMTTPNGAYCLNKLPKFTECADPSMFENVQFKPDSDGHIFLIHPSEIKILAKQSGLLVEKHKLFTNLLTAGHLKTSFLLNLLPWKLALLQEKMSQILFSALAPQIFANSATLFRKPFPKK